MNDNRFFTEACHMYGPVPGKRRWQYRVRDKSQILPNFGPKTVATTFDEAIASQVEDMLNGVSPHATHWKNSYQSLFDSQSKVEARWQSTLDHTNGLLRETRSELENAQAHIRSKNDCLRAAKAEADRLRLQLFEAREQRDEARADMKGGGFWAGSITVYNENMQPERITDILKRLTDALGSAVANGREAERARNEVAALRKQRDGHVCSTAADHVVMALSTYTALVTERDEALAKYAACVDVLSFVDGKWVKTA